MRPVIRIIQCLFFGSLLAACESSPSSVDGAEAFLAQDSVGGFWLLESIDGLPVDAETDPALLFVESPGFDLAQIGCSGAVAAGISQDSQSLYRIPDRYLPKTALEQCFISFTRESLRTRLHQLLFEGAEFYQDQEHLVLVDQEGLTYIFRAED